MQNVVSSIASVLSIGASQTICAEEPGFLGFLVLVLFVFKYFQFIANGYFCKIQKKKKNQLEKFRNSWISYQYEIASDVSKHLL